MMWRKLKYLLIFLILFSFRPIAKNEQSLFGYKHKEYYKTGEVKYVCHEHLKGTSGSGTGVVEKYKFRRLYYDRCGNVKLIVIAEWETGCWRNVFKIIDSKRKNEKVSCTKEEFVYPDLQEIKED